MWTVVLLSLALASSSQAQSPCSSGATRVVPFTSSPVTYAGIVEVCLNGTWGTVCADSPNTLWSEKNAQVFCQGLGLGFSGALNPVDQSTISASYRSPPTTPINYKAVRCNGTETSLSQCSHSKTTTGCTHASDAAVVCRQSVSDGDVRLVGSPTNGQGAVEIYDQASLKWYRVCPTGWTSSYASVVCQTLGYNTGVSTPYSLGSGGLLTTSSVTCTSTKCSSYGYSPCGASSSSYAGVTCESSGNATDSVRLSGGSRASTGRVEVLYNGVWGTVCNISGWTVYEAQAVCNLLGYKNTSTVTITGLSFKGLSALYPVWISGLKCNSTSVSNITQCAYNSPIGFGQNCSHTYDALLDCQSSSSSSLAALGALAVVAAVPAAAAKNSKPICQFLAKCGRILQCCSFVWLRQVAVNIRLLLCCAFLASWRTRRVSHDPSPDTVTVTTTQTTTTIYPPANSEVTVTMETEPPTKPTNPELSEAPPPTYKDASHYSEAPSELPPPQYNVPPPQYSADFPAYLGPEVDPPAGKC
eukprot:Em0005g769a